MKTSFDFKKKVFALILLSSSSILSVRANAEVQRPVSIVTLGITLEDGQTLRGSTYLGEELSVKHKGVEISLVPVTIKANNTLITLQCFKSIGQDVRNLGNITLTLDSPATLKFDNLSLQINLEKIQGE